MISNERVCGGYSIHARRLAETIAGLVQDNDDLNSLRRAVPIPSRFWSEQLASNMSNRFQKIRAELFHEETAGVVATIDKLRSLFEAIETVRLAYFPTMADEQKKLFLSVLVSGMDLLIHNDNNLYAGRVRAAFAGEGFQSESVLRSSFLSERGRPLAFIESLSKYGPLLMHESPRLDSQYSVILNLHMSRQGDDLLRRVVNNFYNSLVKSKYRCPHFPMLQGFVADNVNRGAWLVVSLQPPNPTPNTSQSQAGRPLLRYHLLSYARFPSHGIMLDHSWHVRLHSYFHPFLETHQNGLAAYPFASIRGCEAQHSLYR